MPEVLVPNLTYPGLPPFQEASYTLSQGVQAGTLSVTCQAGDLSQLQAVGRVMMTDGVRVVGLNRCRVDRVIPNGSTTNATYTILILDRRWEWRYRPISGHYNIPAPRVYDLPKVGVSALGQQLQTGNQGQPALDEDSPPQIQEWTRKSAYDLGVLCCRAMRETKYDIRALPRDQYPEVNWEAEIAAEALERLAELYGCRVVFNPLVDQVGVARLGEGANLPDLQPGDVMEFSDGFDPPEPPAFIAVYGAPIRYQCRFRCVARPKDFDGRHKPMADLSYQPFLGWPAQHGPIILSSNTDILNLAGERTFRDVLALANETIYRDYQIYESLPAVIPGGFRIPVNSTTSADNKRLTDIILTPFTVETARDDLGQRNQVPGRLYGKAERGSLTCQPTAEGEEIRIGFTVDAEKQMIRGSQFIRYTDRAASPVVTYPTDLILETAVNVLDRETHAAVRYVKRFPVPGGTGDTELPILREDIKFYHRVNYVSTTEHEVNTVETNQTQCDAQAKYYADAEIAKFTLQQPQTRTYSGIYPITVDGAIQQVSWSISTSAVRTTASRNTEHDEKIPPYNQRRRESSLSLERMARNERTIRELGRGGES